MFFLIDVSNKSMALVCEIHAGIEFGSQMQAPNSPDTSAWATSVVNWSKCRAGLFN